jgi:hypothetical protein
MLNPLKGSHIFVSCARGGLLNKASSYSSVGRRNTYLCNCSAITSIDAVVNGVAYLIVPLHAIPFPRAASSSCPGV